LPEAKDDLLRIRVFLSDINLQAAQKALKAIRQNIDLIAKNPEMGVVFNRARKIRRWTAQFGRHAYIIEYAIENDTLFITRLWHSREDR
jgi:plasmid stabilization system protein ParE